MKNFFSRNLGLKIISLLIALLLFSAAPGNKEVSFRKVFTVPLQIIGEEKLGERELILIPSPDTDTIQITLKGNNATLQNVNVQDLEVSVDLTEVETAGTKELPVAVTGLPPNVTREPDLTVEMKIDHQLSKTVPVKVIFSEQLQGEYADRYVKQSDDQALLTGPKDDVETIAQGSVQVTEDMLKDEDGYLKMTLPIIWMDEQGRPVDSEIIKSSVQFVDVTMYPEKEVPVHVNIQGEAAEGYRIMDTLSVPETIRICADPQTLQQIDQIETRMIDVEGLTGDKTQDIGLMEYNGVFLCLGQPSDVEVLIEVEALSIRTFEITDIEPVNMPNGYRASVLDEPVTVTLKGLASVLNSIEAEDLYAEVDLADAVIGTRKYAVTVRDVPEGVDEVEVEPSRISIRVTS